VKIAIVGVGNILFKDEGVGIYAAKYIEQNYSFDKQIDIIDGGVLGFQLMTYYQDYDRVYIVDTITLPGEKPGSIYNLPAEELLGLGSYKQNAHEVEIVEMLEICSLLEKMADVNILGIVPLDIISVEISLSEVISKSFPAFIDATIKQIQKDGIEVTKNPTQYTLDSVIESYKNPDNKMPKCS
jgi:hydrogenase maturation protease